MRIYTCNKVEMLLIIKLCSECNKDKDMLCKYNWTKHLISKLTN